MQITDRTVDVLECLCIDVGTMPLSIRGNNKFLLMVDEASKFVVTAAMADEKAETIKQVIWNKWMPYFGLPADLHSDEGSNVAGETIRQLCYVLCIDKTISSPYHPQANGLAERSIASIKTKVSSVCQSRDFSVHDWDKVIDECTLAHNNVENESNGFAPTMQLFGANTRLPIDNIMGLRRSQPKESIDKVVIRENVRINQQEARNSYK